MQTQTEAEARQRAEEDIYALTKRADLFLQAGDTGEFERIRLKISELQRKHGATTGIERKDNERTAR